MLYSSVIPFYKASGFTSYDWQHLTFDKLSSLDERNDYAFTVPYKRIVHFDRAKNRVYIPSFYIYTDIEYDSAQPVDCNAIRIVFGDGTSIVSTISVSLGPSFDDFINSLHLEVLGGKILVVSEPGYLEFPNGAWPLGPMSIVLRFRRQYTFENYDYYSDRLYVTDDIHNYIELKWWNTTNLAIGRRIIPYEYGYKPSCFIDTLLGKPEYTFEEELISRLGYNFVQSAVSKKTYRCAFSAPEYLCDSLRIMRICDNKFVTRYDFPNYSERLEPMTMTMDVDWDEQGHLALVNMSFDVDLVAANPSGYIPGVHGDFNNDYNNDFSNS